MPYDPSLTDPQASPVLGALNFFEARQSDDAVKRDLELTCTWCGTWICDIEHGDTLRVLASTAADHACDRPLQVRTALLVGALAEVDSAQAAARNNMPDGSLGDFPLPRERDALRKLAEEIRAYMAPDR